MAWRRRSGIMVSCARDRPTSERPWAVTLLAERGIGLSSSQVHRLVSGTPERLSLAVLAALCDILDVTPAELIATRAENMAPRKAAAAGAPKITDLAAVRPKRARVRPE
jgi:DNA-binding Xre family transcriptional regulator